MKKGLVFVALAPALWGASGTLVQYLFAQGVSADWLVNVRLFFSGLLILLYARLAKKGPLLAIWRNKRSAAHLLLFSIFGMLTTQAAYLLAIAYSDSATATILQFTNTVIIILFTALRLHSWPRRVEVGALLLAISGVLLLVTNGQFDQLSISPLGLFWGLLSAVGAAVYTLSSSKLIREFGAAPVVGWAMLIGSLVYSFYRPIWQDVPALDGLSLLLLLLVIVFGTMIPFTLFLLGVKDVNPTVASMFGATEPLTATLLTLLFLDTTLGPWQFLGMGLVLATVFLLALDQPRILIRKSADKTK